MSAICEKVYAAINPVRFKILEFLRENSDTHVSEIARRMSIDRSTVAYHLGLLENLDLVSSRYEILEQPHSMGKAGRIYKVNEEEIRKVSEAIAKRFSEFER
ncbi:winged helix-turn-helix domain-containing protein [Candidatus Bathyarchaeota archaeon]|nr:winged helix-turn-helix domain-containing protein [Candidatus Bathyarchaeota archaeon]